MLRRDMETDTIICGDCIEVLKTMPDRSVRLAFCDPPYNNGTEYPCYDDKRDDYEDWCRKWFTECRRVAERVIITPGHGNLWMWNNIEKPWGVGCWYKPGNTASSVLGWCCWEPWLYYCHDYKALGGPDTIRATVKKQSDTGDHPCPKPLSLLKELIKKTTLEGDIVIDPFSGSGTTCLAAKLLYRKFIGIEVEKSFVEHAQRRIDAVEDMFE